MFIATAYTSLESLLLFQSLAAFGTDPNVFIKTSELLQSNVLIRHGESYDPGRLSPDALRELYILLLKEEIRDEEYTADRRGDVSPSKKRKLSSPPSIKAKNVVDYKEKLPQLVDRLYARYRDGMIMSIREDERKYRQLQREIEEIERGEWDERILREDKSRANRGGSVATDVRPGKPSTSPRIVYAGDQQQQQNARPITSPSTGPQSSPRTTEHKADGLAIADVLNTNDKPVPRHTSNLETSLHNGTQPLPQPPHQQHVPSAGPSRLPNGHNQQELIWEQPYQGMMPHQTQSQPYPANSSYSPYPNHLYAPYPPPPSRGLSNGLPPLTYGPQPSPPPGQSRPIVLPPPPGARAPARGTHPLDALADIAGQQYRTSASPSLSHGPLPSLPYPQHYPPPPTHYRTDGRQPLNNEHTAWNPSMAPYPSQSPTNYGYPTQPLPGQRPYPPRPAIVTPEQRQYNSPYHPSQVQNRKPSLPEPYRREMSTTPQPRPQPRDIIGLPLTPIAQSFQLGTGKATRWTPNLSKSTPRAPGSPKPPAYEPLSPVQNPTTVDARSIDDSTAPRQQSVTEILHEAGSDSAAPSIVASTLRSRSVMSHADELSLADEGDRNVKQESSTPRLAEDTEDTTADESVSRRGGRRRRDTTSNVAVKRKREESQTHDVPNPRTHVLWTRNFQKISVSALERITAHRNASTFALPIKERDAPGYRDVILQPQDLKSIRSAIVQGSRAGAAVAATAELDDPGRASMMLPISKELMPPKGIVNNAQLEKELMHMFANAVMFNLDPNRGLGPSFARMPSEAVETAGPGMDKYAFDENGVVKDVHAMVPDVQKIIGDLRSAERRMSNGEEVEDEEDELAGDAEQGPSKRRRRG